VTLAAYNAVRALSRFLVAAAAGLLLNGKVDAVYLQVKGEQALVAVAVLFVLACLSFLAESWLKRRAGA
jgi:hypothetical protein